MKTAYKQSEKIRFKLYVENFNRVISYVKVPIEKSIDGKIIKEQLDWLHMIGSRTDVDIMKVLNTKNRDVIVYKSIHDLSYEKACGFTEYMSEISNDRSRILPEWKGFKADWRN